MMRGGALFNHREKPICERFFEEENTTRRYGLHKFVRYPKLLNQIVLFFFFSPQRSKKQSANFFARFRSSIPRKERERSFVTFS